MQIKLWPGCSDQDTWCWAQCHAQPILCPSVPFQDSPSSSLSSLSKEKVRAVCAWCERYVNKPPFHINSTSKYYQIILLTLPAGIGLHLEIISSKWEASKVPFPRQRASWRFCGWIPSSLNTQALSKPPPLWSGPDHLHMDLGVTCSPPKWTHWSSFLWDDHIMILFWPPPNNTQVSSRGAQSSKYWF